MIETRTYPDFGRVYQILRDRGEKTSPFPIASGADADRLRRLGYVVDIWIPVRPEDSIEVRQRGVLLRSYSVDS